MATKVISTEVLNKLKCTNCLCYISVGPVAHISDDNYICGRCTNEESETITIYEMLAKTYLFPCRYDILGCKEAFPFGKQMKKHETFCRNKPYICPLSSFENCEWQGDSEKLQEHFVKDHPKNYLAEAVVALKLEGNKEKRYMFIAKNSTYLLDVVYYQEKGLSVEVMKLFPESDFEQYDLLLRGNSNSSTLTIAGEVTGCDLSSSFLKLARDTIDVNMLRYIGKKEIIIEIIVKSNKEKSIIGSEVIINNRPTSLEDIPASSLKYIFYACKNRDFGCDYLSYLPDVKNHEKKCLLYECPLKCENCSWKGRLEQITTHCAKNHVMTENVLTLNLVELSSIDANASRFYLLKSSAHGLFRVCIKFDEVRKLMYAAVQYIGEASDASSFVFGVKFYSRATINRKNFVCAPLTTDEETFDYCAHFLYETLGESTVTFTVRKKTA